MAVLGGLTGLYGPVDQPHGLTGREAEEWGRPADPRHAVPGDASGELPYAGTGYGSDLEVDPLADTLPAEPPGGIVFDHTPPSHAAPYPRGTEQDPVEAAQVMRRLHGLDYGGPRHQAYTGTPYLVTVDSAFRDSPNDTVLAPVPGQLRQGDDVDQGYGSTQGYGFGFGRQFRRWFRDNIPLDRTTEYAGERPFYGAHPVLQARFDGPDSPYGAAGDTTVRMRMADTPIGSPTAYQQPPNPTVIPAVTSDGYDEGPVIGYDSDWMAG